MEPLFKLLGIAIGVTILFVYFGDIVNPALGELWEYTVGYVDEHIA